MNTPANSAPKNEPAITIKDLRFSYRRGSEELFNGLSFQFPVGKITALTGPSGCGKSTLLYVLGLMLKPSSGEVRYHGQRADNRRDSERSWLRATEIGFIFQDSVLDKNRTIADSIIEPALYAGATRSALQKRANELLTEFGVGKRLDHLPGEISGGQAQRVAIARSLLTNPPIILADEPTGNLDATNTEIVLDALETAAKQGRTVIIASHDPAVLLRVDQVLDLRP